MPLPSLGYLHSAAAAVAAADEKLRGVSDHSDCREVETPWLVWVVISPRPGGTLGVHMGAEMARHRSKALVAIAGLFLVSGVISGGPVEARNPAGGADEVSDDRSSKAKPKRFCQGKRATIVGTKKRDHIIGTPHRDVIWAGGGPDKCSVVAGRTSSAAAGRATS